MNTATLEELKESIKVIDFVINRSNIKYPHLRLKHNLIRNIILNHIDNMKDVIINTDDTVLLNGELIDPIQFNKLINDKINTCINNDNITLNTPLSTYYIELILELYN